MDKVGVVTPYRKQIEKLKEELSRGWIIFYLLEYGKCMCIVFAEQYFI